MIGLFENRRMARWCAVLLAVLAVWVLIADERYASLLRTEKECISALMQKTGAEFPQDLYSLARYQYKVCDLAYREWGALEKTFVYPARIIREFF
jgi:hypothetical protein